MTLIVKNKVSNPNSLQASNEKEGNASELTTARGRRQASPPKMSIKDRGESPVGDPDADNCISGSNGFMSLHKVESKSHQGE